MVDKPNQFNLPWFFHLYHTDQIFLLISQFNIENLHVHTSGSKNPFDSGFDDDNVMKQVKTKFLIAPKKLDRFINVILVKQSSLLATKVIKIICQNFC